MAESNSIPINLGIQLPLIVKGVTLMSPGNWNGYEYSADEIQKAFQNTNWSDDDITSLFLDHPLNASNAAGEWAGRVFNQRLMGTDVLGDLEIWDTQTVINLTKAKAKFGVSPRVVSNLPQETLTRMGKFVDFTYDNFSIVKKPAQSPSYINLSQSTAKGTSTQVITSSLINMAAMELAEEKEAKKMCPTCGTAMEYSMDYKEDRCLSCDKNMKSVPMVENHAQHNVDEEMKGGKKMSQENMQSNPVESQPVLVQTKVELSDADVLAIISQDLAGFTAFSEKKKAENLSVKDLASLFKQEKESQTKFENLSEKELCSILDQATKALQAKGVQPAPTAKPVVAMEMASKVEDTTSQELSSLKKQVATLTAQMNAPAPVSQKGWMEMSGAPVVASMTGTKRHSNGVELMADFLRGFK